MSSLGHYSDVGSDGHAKPHTPAATTEAETPLVALDAERASLAKRHRELDSDWRALHDRCRAALVAAYARIKALEAQQPTEGEWQRLAGTMNDQNALLAAQVVRQEEEIRTLMGERDQARIQGDAYKAQLERLRSATMAESEPERLEALAKRGIECDQVLLRIQRGLGLREGAELAEIEAAVENASAERNEYKAGFERLEKERAALLARLQTAEQELQIAEMSDDVWDSAVTEGIKKAEARRKNNSL